MSLKDDIMEGIAGRVIVQSLEVDREMVLHGVPVWGITVVVPVGPDTQEHLFTFAKSSNMSGQQMGEVIISYLPPELVRDAD